MLEYFTKLTPGEVSQFKKFVISPYFNSNRKVFLLGNYLSSRYPNITPEILNKKVIYRFVFRNQKYNDSNFRKLVSDFNSVFTRFLTELEVEEDIQLKNYLLQKRYYKLKIPEKMNHVHKETINADSKFSAKDLNYYINLFMTEYCYYTYYDYDSSKDRIKSVERLCKFSDWLIIYIKLALYNFEDNLNLVKPQNSQPNYCLRKEINDLMKSHMGEIKKNHPYIFFMHCFDKIRNDNFNFEECEKYYNKNKNLLKGKITEGYLTSYFHHYYKLFMSPNCKEKVSVSKKLFRFLNHFYFKNDPVDEVMNGGYVLSTVLISAINVALYLNKLDWAEKFIEKNINYTPKIGRKEFYSLAKGTIQLHKKDYRSALDSFSTISGANIQHELGKRIGMIIIYYEMKDPEGLKSQLVNFRTFKNNKKTSAEIVSIIKYFLKYFNMLLKIRNMEKNKRREEIIMFKDKLENENSRVSKRKWLLEKIEEL